jgi:hypothetical protein
LDLLGHQVLLELQELGDLLDLRGLRELQEHQVLPDHQVQLVLLDRRVQLALQVHPDLEEAVDPQVLLVLVDHQDLLVHPANQYLEVFQFNTEEPH